MKKIITLFVLAFASIAIHAERTVPYNYIAYRDAVRAKDNTAIKALLDGFELGDLNQKINIANWYINLNQTTGEVSIATPATAIAYANTLIATCEIADSEGSVYLKLRLLYLGRHYAEAYELGKDTTYPKSLLVMGLVCKSLKKYDESITYFIACNDYYNACVTAKTSGDKVKVFEFGKRAALEKYLTATALRNILNYIGEQYYGDTTITEEQQTEFLVAVNQKYSRFLVTDKATWEPILAGVRVTLKARGVSVE